MQYCTGTRSYAGLEAGLRSSHCQLEAHPVSLRLNPTRRGLTVDFVDVCDKVQEQQHRYKMPIDLPQELGLFICWERGKERSIVLVKHRVSPIASMFLSLIHI